MGLMLPVCNPTVEQLYLMRRQSSDGGGGAGPLLLIRRHRCKEVARYSREYFELRLLQLQGDP